MTPEFRATFIHNAPDRTSILAGSPRSHGRSLTAGNASAQFFAVVAETITAAVPAVSYELLDGVDHVPHISAQDGYLERVCAFLTLPAMSGTVDGGDRVRDNGPDRRPGSSRIPRVARLSGGTCLHLLAKFGESPAPQVASSRSMVLLVERLAAPLSCAAPRAAMDGGS